MDDGFEVCGIDNINDYYDPQLKLDRLENLKTYENFSFKKVDISDDLQLLNIIESTKIFFEDIWKQNNQINTSIKLPINISVNSKKVEQIQLIENYLAKLDLVSNFYVTSFNNNNTIYKIIFNGNPNQFLTLMKEKDIDIDTNQEIWKVR